MPKKIARQHYLNLDQTQDKSYLAQCLEKMIGPIIAATDYIRAYPEQVRAYVTSDYYVLGTDGFGRSDTREALREFFEVSRHYIAYMAIVALVQRGDLPPIAAKEAKEKV
ncbi:MAG: hypothetical protein LRY30_01445 [Gammaproteobacteria bacterium]|nr:hypothetical protein [Gammaproteobacteria bacterium]